MKGFELQLRYNSIYTLKKHGAFARKMSEHSTVCVYLKCFNMGVLILFSGIGDLQTSYWALPLSCHKWFL